MRRNMTLVHKPLLRFCFSLPVRAEKEKNALNETIFVTFWGEQIVIFTQLN